MHADFQQIERLPVPMAKNSRKRKPPGAQRAAKPPGVLDDASVLRQAEPTNHAHPHCPATARRFGCLGPNGEMAFLALIYRDRFMAHETTGTSKRRSAGGQYSLMAELVTTREVFQRETEKIFDRFWLFACHVSQLEQHEGILAVDLDHHQVLVVRDAEGTVRAFRNVCRHRGCRLVEAGGNRKSGQRIQCPYHAWTYERDGSLVAAPNMDGTQGFETARFGLGRMNCEVWNGLVFVCNPFEPESGDRTPRFSLSRFLDPLSDLVRHWGIGELRQVQNLEYDVAANWKLLFQNYNECYHCPTVHPALNRLTPFTASDNDLTEGPILGGPMALAEGVSTMSEDGSLAGAIIPTLDQAQRRRVYYFTIFPNLFLSLHPDYVMLHRLSRVAPDHTKIDCQFLFPPDSADGDQARTARAKAIRFWDLTNRQDWEVCEGVQRGMSDPGYQPGPYSDLESVVAAFDRYYLPFAT